MLFRVVQVTKSLQVCEYAEHNTLIDDFDV